jgi:putative Mg2+ transporter-C (MgtC) family protein
MVVGGVGFLGGGIVWREGVSVRGMNTAATLWCSAAVGATVGAGRLAEAAVGAAAVILTNFGLRPVVRRLEARSRVATNVETAYRVRVVCGRKQEDTMRLLLLQRFEGQSALTLQGMTVADEGPDTVLTAAVSSPCRVDAVMNELAVHLRAEAGVSSVGWDRR